MKGGAPLADAWGSVGVAREKGKQTFGGVPSRAPDSRLLSSLCGLLDRAFRSAGVRPLHDGLDLGLVERSIVAE